MRLARPRLPGRARFPARAGALKPTAAPPQGGAYGLVLSEGVSEWLARGSRTALLGDGALTAMESLASEPAAGLILADPVGPLHSAYSVGDQIGAVLGGTRRAGLDRATDLLEMVGVPEPHERVLARPHQLSALDRQRVQVALALARRPALLLAEDPTDGLSQADAAAFAAMMGRLHARLGFTFVMTAPVQTKAERLVDEILILADGRVAERRRRQT